MFSVVRGIGRQSSGTQEKYRNEKLTSGCLWAITHLWGKSHYAICMSSGNEMLWNWAFCGILSPKISVYSIDFTAGETKAPRLNTITEHAGSKPGEEAELLALLPPVGDAPLPITTLREMLIYVSCFLDLISPSVRLYYIYPVSGGGDASQTQCCCWSPATEHLSISVTVQNAGYLFTSWEEECP